jgi:hypothetical protein
VSSGNPCPEGTECIEEDDACREEPPPDSCKLSTYPSNASVYTRETIQFSATLSGDCNNPCYEWEVESSIGSSIDSNGWYRAGDTPGTDTVMVTDPCNNGISATAEVEVMCADSDGDSVCDSDDNCPEVRNQNQADSDVDGAGDACDNCPFLLNADQLNSDGDTLGDACDNCPYASNEDQVDRDEDGMGDVCDPCPLLALFGEGSKEVETLRKFRDEVLSQTSEGREIIRLYYEWSPAIVETMNEDEGFKEELKEIIDGVLNIIRGNVE